MKILQYCQHIWGVGHFFRSLGVSRALAGHEVVMIRGGPPVDYPLPEHVRAVQLPGLMTDRHYRGLFPVEAGRTFAEVAEQRRKALWRLVSREAADVLLVELYPFGRKAFRFELDPVLAGIRDGSLPRCRVVCSLRDILVAKKDPQGYERRVVRTLNRSFDALLVHADSRVLRLEETFGRVEDIGIPVVYTGFVARRPQPGAGRRLRARLGIDASAPLVVASAGGGKIGIRLLAPVIEAFGRVAALRHGHLCVFTGPFMEQSEFEQLSRQADGRVHIARFADDFIDHLAAADLSVSMAGYNTCMDILATGVRALVWPYSGDREQGMRAGRLERLGCLKVLGDGDLAPGRLEVLMARQVRAGRPAAAAVDLDGGVHTARWLQRWLQSPGEKPVSVT